MDLFSLGRLFFVFVSHNQIEFAGEQKRHRWFWILEDKFNLKIWLKSR